MQWFEVTTSCGATTVAEHASPPRPTSRTTCRPIPPAPWPRTIASASDAIISSAAKTAAHAIHDLMSIIPSGAGIILPWAGLQIQGRHAALAARPDPAATAKSARLVRLHVGLRHQVEPL